MTAKLLILSLVLSIAPGIGHAGTIQLTATQQKRYELDLAHWQSLLNQYHQGLRDDNDGAIILFHMSVDYRILGESDTPDAQAVNSERNALLEKHPELKINSPTSLHGRMGARQAVEVHLSAKQRSQYQADLAHWQSLLGEYHRGIRNDDDGAAILFHVAIDYAILGSSDTTAAQSIEREWRALVTKHPEFKTHRPTRLHEQVEARENASQEAKALAGTAIVPSDSHMSTPLTSGHFAVALYQYHVAFFRLPPEVATVRGDRPQWLDGAKRIGPGDMRQLLKSLQPIKTMSFAHRISWAPMDYYGRDLKFVWLCENLLLGYSGSNDDESKALRARYPRTHGMMPWTNSAAKNSGFCGAVSLDGRILYQLPVTQHDPDTLVGVAPMTNQDASSVVLKVFGMATKVAKTTQCGEDDCVNAGESFQQVQEPSERFIYTYPDRLESFPGSEEGKYAAALKAHGFDPVLLQRYGF